MLYDAIGYRYQDFRRPDPRIRALIFREIDPDDRVVNVGAGTGSYEPAVHDLIAVEPSRTMISQRTGSPAPVVRAAAENLPFGDKSFDVALAVLTVHHWSDPDRGLREMLRTARKKIVLLTWIGFVEHFWLLDYLPQIKKIDESLFWSIEELGRVLGRLRVIEVPIAHDCRDGFLCAYWRRPWFYLDENARRAISTFARIEDCQAGLGRLRHDLESGRWHEKYQAIQHQENMDFGYRLVVADL